MTRLCPGLNIIEGDNPRSWLCPDSLPLRRLTDSSAIYTSRDIMSEINKSSPDALDAKARVLRAVEDALRLADEHGFAIAAIHLDHARSVLEGLEKAEE